MIPSILPALALVAAVSASPASSPAEGESSLPPRMAELVKQLQDPDWDIRMEAATALGNLGPEAKPALPYLVVALKDPVPTVRMKAVDALMFMRAAAAEAAPLLLPMLEDADELVRISVVVALPRVTAPPSLTTPVLKKMLSDNAWRVRRQAAIELIQMKAEVPAAIPVLREASKDPVIIARLTALAVLGGVVEPPERKAIAAMAAEFIGEGSYDVRVQAIRTLSALGPESVPHLVGVLTKSPAAERSVQMAAVQALGRIGPDAKAALPALQQVMSRKGIWLKVAQRSIAAIEGTEPKVPEETVGPVPQLADPTGQAPTAPSPGPRAPPSPGPSPRP